MKIKTVRIENFRRFNDETIPLNAYSCLVGANGSGKSTVLNALNVFFREQSGSSTDISKLTDEDFFQKETSKPVRITVTFDDLGKSASADLSDYVRQGELVVTAEALFDVDQECATVRHYGQRLGLTAFRPYFDGVKAKMSATELKSIFDQFRKQFEGLSNAGSKDARADALREYEANHPEECDLIPSEDDFYGVNSTGKLSMFVQWVYVPAVKHASEEGEEVKNSAFGRLIARAVRSRVDFAADLESLRTETYDKYKALLDENNKHLDDIATSLKKRLETWAHPNVQIGMEWTSDASKAVTVQQPAAGLKTGDGGFVGSLARMGHGLQRSYLIALLQELSSSDATDAPTLILGCEEPELYQHPPQARHLSDVFTDLSEGNSQVIVTTHSPYFVTGNGFENVRVVRSGTTGCGASVASLTFDSLCQRLRTARGEDSSRPPEGLIAKIHQALRPHIAEMFFTRVPILVEGLEDVSYITTALHLTNQWSEFRRLGCHLIPVNNKSNLIQPLAIAKELGVPVFVIFDSDSNTPNPEHRHKHELDNKAIRHLLGLDDDPFPSSSVRGLDHVIWTTNLGDEVEQSIANANQYMEAARKAHGHEKGLTKHDSFIVDWLTAAHGAGDWPETLDWLCSSILGFAANDVQ